MGRNKIKSQEDFYNTHLTNTEKNLWNKMKDAANSNTLTQFIDATGYGAIFGLIENMSIDQANLFMHFLEGQLQHEALLAA